MNVILCSADDSLRDRWKNILKNSYQVSEAGAGAELLSILKSSVVDLVVLHRSLVDMDFINHMNSIPFIVLADIPGDEEAVGVLRAGALGYANSYMSKPRLLEAVGVAISGRVWIGKALMQKIIRGSKGKAGEEIKERPSAESLTSREQEVARLVSRGYSNHEIGGELGISERTVKAHVSAIFKKTHTTSRLQLALFMKSQLVER